MRKTRIPTLRRLHHATALTLCAVAQAGCNMITGDVLGNLRPDKHGRSDNTIIYYLPRTELRFTAEVAVPVTLAARCPRPDGMPAAALRYELRSPAVSSVIRPDREQAYYLHAAPHFGKDLNLSLELDEQGLLVSAAAAQTDKVLPVLGDVLATAAKAALVAAAAGPKPLSEGTRDECAAATAERQRFAQELTDVLKRRPGGLDKALEAGDPLSAVVASYRAEIARLEGLFVPGQRAFSFALDCRIDPPAQPGAPPATIATVVFDANANQDAQRLEASAACTVTPSSGDLAALLKNYKVNPTDSDVCFTLTLATDISHYPQVRDTGSAPAVKDALVYRLPQLTDYTVELRGCTSQSGTVVPSGKKSSTILRGTLPISQWGRLATLSLKSLNDSYSLTFHGGSGAPRKYERKSTAPELKPAVEGVQALSDGIGKVVDAQSELGRLKRQADILEQQVKIKGAQRDLAGAASSQTTP